MNEATLRADIKDAFEAVRNDNSENADAAIDKLAAKITKAISDSIASATFIVQPGQQTVGTSPAGPTTGVTTTPGQIQVIVIPDPQIPIILAT